MAEPNENIEFMFMGDLSDLDRAFDHVDARQDAMAAKASSAQKTIQQEYGITSNVIKRQGQESSQSAEKMASLSSSLTGSQKLVQAEYGITSDIIKRQAAGIELTGDAAQKAYDKMRAAEDAARSAAGIHLNIANEQAQALRVFQEMWQLEAADRTKAISSGIKFSPKEQSEWETAWSGGGIKTKDPAFAAQAAQNVNNWKTEQDLGNQLATDRIKWAGQHVAAEETIKASILANSRAKMVAGETARHLATIEAKAAQATKQAGTAAENAAAQFLGLSGGTGALSSAMSFLVSPVGLVVAGIAAIAASGVLATAILFGMATGAAAFADDLTKTNAETGLHYNNILALKTAAASAHVSYGTLISGVSMLEKKLGNMDTATDRVSKGLKKWGIDSKDINVALPQIIEHLGEFDEKGQRTQVAMDLMGVGGKAWAAVTKEMTGNMTTYTASLAKMGIELGGNSLETTNRFSEAQAKLAIQWEVIKFKVESAATPIAERWLKGISDWLTKNQTQIIAWGESFVPKMEQAAISVYNLMDATAKLYKLLQLPFTLQFKIIRSITDAIQGGGENPFEGKDYSRQGQFNRMGGGLSNATAGISGSIKAAMENPFAREPKGGGKGGGTDPAQHAIKMEQERLKQALAGFQHEQDQWDDMLRNKWATQDAFNKASASIEISRSGVTMKALQKEYDQAAKLKKVPAREEKQAEIFGRMQQEANRFYKASKDIETRINSEKLAADQQMQANSFAKGDALDRLKIANINGLARHRIITEESAIKQILTMELAAMDARTDALHASLPTDTKSAEYIRIQGLIGTAEVERSARFEQASRDAIEAGRKELNDRIQFTNRMRGLDQDLVQSRIQIASQMLEHSIATGGLNNPNAQRDARVELAIYEEKERTKNLVLDLNERKRVELMDKHGQEIVDINTRYGNIIADAEKASAERRKILTEKWKEEMHSALVSLSGTWANNIEQSITAGFQKGVGAGARTFGAGILEMIHGMAMRQLEAKLLEVFEGLAGRGGIIGKIFEAITGVKKGKAPTDPASVAADLLGSPESTKDTIAGTLGKAQSAASLAQERATAALNAARVAQTRELQQTIQVGIEHLCACNKVEPAGFLETVVSAAIGGAATGAGDAIGGGGEGEDTSHQALIGTRQTTPAAARGKSFGSFEKFDVGENGRETVFTNDRGGYVVPNSSISDGTRGNQNINITLNAPVLGRSSHSTPKSRREYMQMLAPALEGALRG